MRRRIVPPYLVLLLTACAGTEVGNPTFACGGEDASAHAGEYPDDWSCSPDGSDCGLAATADAFPGSCPGGTSRSALHLLAIDDEPIAGTVWFSGTPTSFELASGEELVLPLVTVVPASVTGTWTPPLRVEVEGRMRGTLELRAAVDVGPDAPRLEVLCGSEAPCELLDLGAAEVGASASAVLDVVNDGCLPFDLATPDTSDNEDLDVADERPFPARVEPRGRLGVGVAATPVARGPTGGTLRLVATPGGERLVPWQVRGL